MIRKFTADDIESIMKLWLKGNTEAHGFIDKGYWESCYNTVRDMLPHAEIYVYESEDEIKAFAGINGNYIEGIFADEKCRSLGIGKALIDFLKEMKNELELGVYVKNKRAVSFYKREGFEIQCEKTDENTGEKEYVMKWRSYNIEKEEGSRRKYIDLLLQGDEDEKMLGKYIDKGDMFVLMHGRTVIGQCIVVKRNDNEYEIKNIAVAENEQGKGYGKKLIDHIWKYYGDCNVLYAGTGDSDMTIPFYEKCGFKRDHIVENFFKDNYEKPIIENGKVLCHMIYMKKERV